MLLMQSSYKHFHLIIAGILTILLAGCGPEAPGISPKEAATMFSEQKAIIIDVRENDEWQEQHIEGAIHIPLDQVESRLSELAEYKDTDIVMQCRSGRRSAIAGKALMKAGFTKVHNLTGGILAWDENGLETVHGKPMAKKQK